MLTHQGALTSYYLGVSDGAVHLSHNFLFTWPYAMGISTAVFVPEFNMLLVGGVTTTEQGERETEADRKTHTDQHRETETHRETDS